MAAPVRTCTAGHSKSGGRVGPPAADALALLAVAGGRCVLDAADAQIAIEQWFADAGARRSAGAQASAMVERGRGAAERSLALVERLLG